MARRSVYLVPLLEAGASRASAVTVGWWRERCDRVAQRRVIRTAVRLLAARPAPHPGGRYAALRQLLVDAVTALRLAAGRTPVPALVRPAAACRISVPVRSRLATTEVAVSLDHHVTALIQDWPQRLIAAPATASAPAVGAPA